MTVLRRRALVACACLSAVGVIGGHLPPCTGDEYDRIVGGCDARSVDLSSSFAILLTNEGTWRTRGCGGVLITPRHILTAAHCDIDTLRGALVNATVLANGPTSALVTVSRRIAHPAWTKVTKTFDVMILELAEPLPERFLPHQLQLATPEYEKSFNTATTFVTCGFGKESALAQSGVDHLACVRMPHRPDCGSIYWGIYDGNSMICAGKGGMDACQGDSGGPMYHKGADGKWTLVGIVSFGKGCAEQEFPGVYARVSSTIGWLKANGVTGLKLAGAATSPAPSPGPVPQPAPGPAPALAPAGQPLATADVSARILDTHNRLRCLHWSGGNRWAANLTWSSALAAQAARRLQTSEWGDDRGMVTVELASSIPGSPGEGVQETYKAGLYRTEKGTGEKVARKESDFAKMVEKPDNAWKEMRQYVDIVWRGTSEVGCARASQAGKVETYLCAYGGKKTRVGMAVSEAWAGISRKEQISAVTQDGKVAKACGIDLSLVTMSKSLVNTEGGTAISDDGSIKDGACAARPWLFAALVAAFAR